MAAKYGKINVLRKYGDALVEEKFINEVGDSWLHEAARYGKTDVAIFIIEKFQETMEHTDNVFNSRGEHFSDGALFSVEISRDQKIEFVHELNQKIPLEKIFKVISSGKQDQTDGNSAENKVKTMLHKIAAHGLSELVIFFGFEELDKTDERGNTAFHVSATYGQLETLQKLVTLFEHKRAMYQKTALKNLKK